MHGKVAPEAQGLMPNLRKRGRTYPKDLRPCRADSPLPGNPASAGIRHFEKACAGHQSYGNPHGRYPPVRRETRPGRFARSRVVADSG